MLPSDLLRVRIRRGLIQPLYSHFSWEDIYIAERLIEVFQDHVGEKRGIIEEELAEVEKHAFSIGLHPKFTRGLIHLLNRRATFEKPKTRIKPIKARLEVFYEAGRNYGIVVSEEERRNILERVSSKFGLSVEELWSIFSSVYEEEDILRDFKPMDAVDLLKEYNLSLTQTLLFKALKLNIAASFTGTQAKIFLFNVKRLGLMYEASVSPSGILLRVDGPLTAIRQTERYGTRLARLIPYVFSAKGWSITAEIKRKRIYVFRLDSTKSSLFPRVELRYEEYDSSVEEDFARRWSRVGSGWAIVREPEPLVVRGRVFVPDFVFKKDGKTIYMEVVGFWTKDYLERKIRKLKELKEVDIILAVNKELSCSDLERIRHHVIWYRRRIPVDEVYRYLRRYENKVERCRRKLGELSQEVLSYLNSIKEAPLTEVAGKLREYGLSEEEIYVAILASGLKIIWKGIDPEKAVVCR